MKDAMTKGPYTVRFQHDTECHRALGHSDTDTAYFIDTPSGEYQDKSNAEANARLFSAAPMMLDLMMEASKALADAGYGSRSTELDEIAVSMSVLLNEIVGAK